jgi:hypothetical protein
VRHTTVPASRATRSRSIPAGLAATGRASPPPAGSSHSRATSSSGSASGAASGSSRVEVNSSDPSGRKAALASPGAERVSRRGAAWPAGSSSHRALVSFLPSGPGVATEVTSRPPSGDRTRPATRGSLR